MRPEGGFGGTPTAITYTDARFESVTDEVEDLLGDLLGVEAASEQMLHLYDARSEADEAAGEKTQTTTFQLTMPTRHSYTVFPVLEISYGDQEQN